MSYKTYSLEVCVLTIGGHEEASGDLLSLTEVGLNLVASGIKLPAMDAAGFDIQHIKALLLMTARRQRLCVCLWFYFYLSLPSDFCHH